MPQSRGWESVLSSPPPGGQTRDKSSLLSALGGRGRRGLSSLHKAACGARPTVLGHPAPCRHLPTGPCFRGLLNVPRVSQHLPSAFHSPQLCLTSHHTPQRHTASQPFFLYCGNTYVTRDLPFHPLQVCNVVAWRAFLLLGSHPHRQPPEFFKSSPNKDPAPTGHELPVTSPAPGDRRSAFWGWCW